MLVVRDAVVGPFAANTFLVGDDVSGEALLIDPGGDLDRVLPHLLEPGRFRVGRIFLTHGHIDHVSGCLEAKRRLGVPCQIHREDETWVKSLPEQAAMFGFDGLDRAPEIDHFHEDGETVALGEHVGRVIHTPGHSRGSCCLFFEKDRTLFSGDTLFAGSVGRTDLPGGDFDELSRSIKEKLFPLGDERMANPFVGDAARKNRFL